MADARTWLAEQFELKRAHLQGVAYRMLGSSGEAEDAVQECWVRLNRADTTGVANLGGWLTTVVARVCLDMLRARMARREEPLDVQAPPPAATTREARDPEQEALLADSVGVAMLLVLDALDPAERVAFVLHDMFDVPFDEIASIVGRSAVATRQLASRARRRVRGAGGAPDEADRSRQREIVEAFLAAARGGDFTALLALLDPEVVLRADQTAVLVSASRRAEGAPVLAPEIHGASSVADALGRARGAQLALVDGAPAAAWAPGGRPRVAFLFEVEGGRIVDVEIVADPDRLATLDLTLL